MMKRSLLVLTAMIAVGVIFQPHEAEAVAVGQSCSSPGATGMSNDQRNAVMCLSDGSGSLVWKQLSVDQGSVTAPARAPRAEESASSRSPSHWAGWYAGVDGGYSRTTDANTDKNYVNTAATTDHILGGGTLGLVGGYNWVKNNGLFYGRSAGIRENIQISMIQ